MFSVEIFTFHSWEYISWKWTCLIEIWISWFQKELAITHFQILHMMSQKELWKPDLNLVSQGCQHEKILKFTSKIRTLGPCNRCILTLDHQSQIHCIPTKLSMWRSQLREQICQTSKSDRQEWQSLVVWNGIKIFLNGTYISFLKFICGILNWGMANSFWNHVNQISSRQMYFQDIYSNLWKRKVCIVEIFTP